MSTSIIKIHILNQIVINIVNINIKTTSTADAHSVPEQESAKHNNNINKTDMEFVQKFTPLDFQVKNFTPSILPNFSFSKKKHKK